MAGGKTEDLSRSLASVDTVDELIRSVIPDYADRLEHHGEIARGGMASIHMAVDRALHRRIALKLIHPDHQISMLAVRAFLREAQITGQLDHPNIVPVHEINTNDDGQLFFSMKLVEGRTLQDLIDALRSTHDRIDQSGAVIATAVEHDELMRLLDVYFKVLDAVAFAHSRGVVHCDLKPENVMVGDYGQVYLMDWGIAKVLPEPPGQNPLARRNRVRDTLPPMHNAPNVIMGTPAYMSPEQARGEQRAIDERSDIFALGAMLFEILAGHPPYQGRSAVDVLMQAEEAAVELPAEIAVPRGLRRIVRAAMAKLPVDRYERVEDLQSELHDFLRGGSNLPRQTFANDEWIIRENEVGDAAYIIISGRCEVTKVLEGRAQVLRTLGPGDVFGETAILASRPRTASIRALTEVVVVTVNGELLEREVGSMKPWMGAFVRTLAQRFSEATAIPEAERRRLIASQSAAHMQRASLEHQRLARSPRTLEAVTPAKGSLNDPAQVANQALMMLKSWGRWDRDLGQTMSLRRATQNLATICGLQPDELLTILGAFRQFLIEPKHDAISLRDERSLIAELERVLKL